MRVIIATFGEESDAEAYRQSLRDVFGLAGSAVGVGTIAAHGEPYHEHRLVVERPLSEVLLAVLGWSATGTLVPVHAAVMPEPLSATRL